MLSKDQKERIAEALRLDPDAVIAERKRCAFVFFANTLGERCVARIERNGRTQVQLISVCLACRPARHADECTGYHEAPEPLKGVRIA